MPINSTLSWIKGLLDELPMPGGAPPLRAFIKPPPVDDNPFGEPHAYVWPMSGEESRRPDRGGTVPRALSKPAPGTANSAFKGKDHTIHVYVIHDEANDDEQGDSWFPGMIDAIEWQLRVSLDPAVVTDPYDGTISSLIDVGETMHYEITVRALSDQKYWRYDCLLILPILELIQS